MDDIQNLVLDKAKERFLRFGYKKTTMDEISRDCKISKKTIYQHFQDKENLFRSLLVRETIQSKEVIFARVGEIENPLERLSELLRVSIEYCNEDHFMTRMLQDDDASLYSTLLNDQEQSLVRREIISVVAAIIREGKDKGLIRDVDEQVVAYVGLHLSEAFSYMRTNELDPEKMRNGYYVQALLDFLINGLKK